MLKKINLLALFASFFLLFGCATSTKMAFESEGETVTEKNTIFLMTARIENLYKKNYQPKLIIVNVEKEPVENRDDRINFVVDEKSKVNDQYLIRMELKDGDYVLRGLTSNSYGFLINGFFFAPIHEGINVEKNGVFYLGHVDAVVRERADNEFKAGASIPLLDQAVVGASGGTFDIKIMDNYESDIKMFREKFSALKNVEINKQLLPPFNRVSAQKWWEEN